MRCAIYVRVSTDKEEQRSSLDYQKSLFFDLLDREGWELHQIYVDVESGTTDKRENFLRMISDAENQRFDCILAKELSRLARNGELAYKIRRVLQSQKIHLITLDGAINTTTDNTDKFGLYAWLYEQESQNTSNRIKLHLKQKMKRGEFKGSVPPYGYKVEDGQLKKRDDRTVEAVKLIFRLYLKGRGVESIAKELDLQKFPTPGQVAKKKNAGKYWQGSSVKIILQNKHYVGDLVQNRSTTRSVVDKSRDLNPESEWIVVTDAHESIISRDDFEAVQALMKSRYVKRPKVKKHLFTNYVFCADCGTSLWYLQNRQGYTCGRHRKHGKAACTSHAIKETVLKKMILADIRELAQSLDVSDDLLEKFRIKLKRDERSKEKRISQIEQEIDTLKDENRDYIRLLAKQQISQDDYQDITSVNRSKMAKLHEELIVLKQSFANQQNDQQLLYKLTKELERVLEFGDLTEELLHRLIERIEVKENQEIVIHYRFANPFSFVV